VTKVLDSSPNELKKTRKAICSCGNKLNDCPFWQKVSLGLQKKKDKTISDKYLTVLDIFEKTFGQNCLPVDSSKYLSPLELLYNNSKIEVRVLHLIRDVRSFTISHLDNAKRMNLNVIKRNPMYWFLSWYRNNRKIQKFIRKNNIKSIQIGYEELCIYPHLMIRKICDFLDVEPNPSMISLKDSGSHIMRGNRMRYQKSKHQKILYDNRWFSRNEWILTAAILPNIMAYNRKRVYNNLTDIIWNQ
jgi:hypothetical protein